MIEKELQKENEALEEYEVKEIIDHWKYKNGTIKYCVKVMDLKVTTHSKFKQIFMFY